MAAYRSSSLASATPSSSGSVVSAHARVIPSLLASGARMHSATIATTRLRSREALASISLSKPSRRMAVSTASTWPWARERTTSRPSSTGPNLSPFRMRRIASICSSGSDDRFTSVRFLTRLPSRTLSRSKYAGRELRLGIVSMCMTHTSHDSPVPNLSHGVAHMTTSRDRSARATNAKSPNPSVLHADVLIIFCGNFGLMAEARHFLIWQLERGGAQSLKGLSVRDIDLYMDARAPGQRRVSLKDYAERLRS